ncbi:nucleotidyltransferase domain-containing protein [Pedobacter cryophilus]|uniref:Nucleotidyltransferase domain-containing protein n=1 Tax=Pedobacter cryophilus TaxID=2571271 RepID=A0A4U1BYI3_9SPHI|nr:nucleotidyltransferase domain-containing protein [Pedobacter cryophilus]TKB97538.1 nucleotidyltransferase domain-containing protein [Pedobacter cryophilus]
MFGLKEEDIEAIQQIFSKNEKIEEVILYGSRAKGNYKTSSDIDLTIVTDELTLQELQKIEGEIDDLLLPYQLDLSIFKQISNPDLIDHIKRVGVPFYRKDKISY